MQKTTDRALRVAALVKRELAMLLKSQVRDSVVSNAVISDVEVSRDLSLAKVYLLFPENMDTAEAVVLERLDRATGFLRTVLSKRLQLRRAVNLRFFMDDAWRRSVRIERLLLEEKQR